MTWEENTNGTGPQLVRYAGRDRRKRGVIERRGVWSCAKCYGATCHIVGSAGIGVRIRKCSTCGMMDRREVDERRRYDPAAAQGPTRLKVALAVGTVVAAILAAVGALIGSGVGR